MGDEARVIEEFFLRRYGRHALYLPSGRLALYLAFRQWLRPGDRVLMSPLTDDVVFFTVLAAELVPVLGPVDPSTGNIDPVAIGESTWTRLRAHRARSLLSTVGAASRPRKWLARLRDRLFPSPMQRSGHRLPYETTAVLQARKEGGGLDRFDQWIRVDKHLYRTWPLRSS